MLRPRSGSISVSSNPPEVCWDSKKQRTLSISQGFLARKIGYPTAAPTKQYLSNRVRKEGLLYETNDLLSPLAPNPLRSSPVQVTQKHLAAQTLKLISRVIQGIIWSHLRGTAHKRALLKQDSSPAGLLGGFRFQVSPGLNQETGCVRSKSPFQVFKNH